MRILAFVIAWSAFLPFSNVFCQKSEITVVIDPGHGGYDPGHLSDDTKLLPEKDLNLKIAMFLGGYIEKNLQHVKVIYTRTTDIYPSLDDRVGTANSIHADYFISIHCNGNERKMVHGTESHVHSMKTAKAVGLAREIENQFSSRAGRHSRGVKDKNDLQHSLQVLKYTTMTSVLVECGFVTNEKEAAFLNTSYGQEIIASAIFRGFRTFIQKEHTSISFIRTTPVAEKEKDQQRYSIQLMSSKEPVDVNGQSFNKLKMNVVRKELETTNAYRYIYLAGEFNSKKEAENALDQVRKNGFKDAIIVRN